MARLRRTDLLSQSETRKEGRRDTSRREKRIRDTAEAGSGAKMPKIKIEDTPKSTTRCAQGQEVDVCDSCPSVMRKLWVGYFVG